MNTTFRALVVRRSDDRKSFTRSIESRSIADLPQGDLLVRVRYSSLNFKDGLSCVGNPGVTRRYPHTPGIDAAGVVESSRSGAFQVGDEVVIVGQSLGMDTPGGFGQYIRIPATWAASLPEGLSLRDSMIYGTAGFTAALSVQKLQESQIKPEFGSLFVTGATGGGGCISLAILSKLGYSVAAITGKLDSRPFLLNLGAREVIDRESIANAPSMPLLKEIWSGGIDTVGGKILSNLLKSCKEGGVVAATGLVASQDLPVSVLPFILRGVSLLGINAQGSSMEMRKLLWKKLAKEWRPDVLNDLAKEYDLDDLNPQIDKILEGRQQGRVIVNMD